MSADDLEEQNLFKLSFEITDKEGLQERLQDFRHLLPAAPGGPVESVRLWDNEPAHLMIDKMVVIGVKARARSAILTCSFRVA